MFLIYDEDMNQLFFPDGVKPLDIFISSISKNRTTEQIEGVDGKIDYGFVYSEREINLEMLMKAHDTRDYRLLRDSLNGVLDKVAYVAEEYQPGKIYNVVIDEGHISERFNNNQRFAEVDVACSMPGLPFAKSIGTTQDIERDGIDANDALWGFGMGLTSDDDSLAYTHTGASFRIYNAGNVIIHPFMQDLKITIDNIRGASDGFELLNKTNGTAFKINEPVNANQEIVLDGPNITSNDIVIDPRTTNRGFIQLSAGWNEFEINGADNARTAFDFRFYYL